MRPDLPASWLTTWHPDPAAVALTLLVALPYAAAWWCAPRPHRPHPWRATAYLLVGVVLLAYATWGPVGVLARHRMWALGLQAGLLTAVVPLGVGLGRPVELACAALRSDAPVRASTGRVGRVATFPLVSSLVVTLSVLAVFLTPYGGWAAGSPARSALLSAHLLVVGVLAVLPLLTDAVLPGWATPGVRALVGCVDGLLDAVPGIVVMSVPGVLLPSAFAGRGPTDQRWAGGALLAVTEAVGLPLVCAIFAEWQRTDRRRAREVDAALDAAAADGAEAGRPWWLSAP